MDEARKTNAAQLGDLLCSQFDLMCFVTRDRAKVYEKATFTGNNFTLTVGGGGGPEPEYVYHQPTRVIDALIAALKLRGVDVRVKDEPRSGE